MNPTSSKWQNLLARFGTASPELVARRELRCRTESKFVLSPTSTAELVHTLSLTGQYVVLAANHELIASYRTLYFDTEELDFFHAHRRGRRIRHKVRIRHYADRRLTLLEVKTRRRALQTSKIWREHEYGDSKLVIADQAFVGVHAGVDQTVLPQVWTSYRRLTLLGVKTNERITIDLDLVVEAGQNARSLRDVAIVEVKQLPFSRATSAMSTLRAAGRRPAWISKYCVALAFTRSGIRLGRLLPGLRALERTLERGAS